MPVPTARAALLKKRLDSFTKTFHGVEHGDVSALHHARVASRRLREILPTLQVKRPAAIHKLGKRLRKVTKRLGVVRELDVLVLLIDELVVSWRDRASAAGRVGVTVAKERDAARKRLSARMPIGELHRIARKLDRLVENLVESAASGPKPSDRSWRWVVEARVARRATDLLTALNEAGAIYIPERLHAVRIAMKKLRYTAELLGETGGDREGASLALLRRGQALLGRMHDLDVLLERVRRVQASLVPPSLPVWRDLDTLVVSLENETRRVHGRFMRIHDAVAEVATTWSGGARTHTVRAETRRTRAS